MIDRWFYAVDAEHKPVIDHDGTLVPKGWHRGDLLTAEELAALPGGFLIAEAGVGKTTAMIGFQELLGETDSIRRFELGMYAGSESIATEGMGEVRRLGL